MADLRGYYDPSVPADTGDGADVLPADTYAVKVRSSEWKDNRNKTGQYLQLNMGVVEGPYEGSTIVERLNLKNPSDMAVRIAKGTLNAICEAIGIRDVKDSAELEGVRFQLVLKCDKYKYTNEAGEEVERMTNVVQRYIKRGETATTPQQGAGDGPKARTAPGSAPEAPGTEDRPPW